MLSQREADEFDRIRLLALIERDRGLIARYDEHQDYYRADIEVRRHELGRIDERLEGTR